MGARILEAVIVVESIEPLTRLLKAFGGWRVRAEGVTAEGAERVLASPAPGAAIRLIAPHAPRLAVRSHAMPWDTGFAFDLYMNVADVREAERAFVDAGWQAFNDPVEYAAVGLHVTEIIVRGPHGVCFCLMQRHEPALDPAAFAGARLSPWFNMAVPTPAARHAAAVEQVVARLGWTVRRAAQMSSVPPGDTPNGQPRNLAIERPRRFTQLGLGSGEGPTLQILSFEGLDGRDLAGRAHPAALGIRGPRTAVADLDRLSASLAPDALLGPARQEELPGLGRRRILQMTGPEGVVVDLIEAP